VLVVDAVPCASYVWRMTTSTEILPVPPGWPEPPAAAVYHGLAGDIVSTIAPHTEADPVAVLVQLLVACGALIGRGAWYRAEATRHYPAEFVVLVGESSLARKGSSYDHVEQLLGEVDPEFLTRMENGLSSGEGLVWSLRDRDGKDAGAQDRRLLVTEPEFARVLKGRELSTLSPVLRQAWDGRRLGLLTRNSPLRASEAHLAVIGHITATELRHSSTSISVVNGFLNRFLFVACRRTQLLPEGGDENPLGKTGLKDRLAEALEHAQGAGQLRLHSSAKRQWRSAYKEMSKRSMDGVGGALTARAEAHCIRLALIYALLDGASSIHADHLQAASALWAYAASSAAWAFAESTGDPLAEQIHRALQENPGGLTRTQLHEVLHRNHPAAQIKEALGALQAVGRAQPCKKQNSSGGRPAELWSATTPGDGDSVVLSRAA
jgi:hypothetical protein